MALLTMALSLLWHYPYYGVCILARLTAALLAMALPVALLTMALLTVAVTWSGKKKTKGSGIDAYVKCRFNGYKCKTKVINSQEIT